MRRGPCPKSVKESRILYKDGLGDSSGTSDTEDEIETSSETFPAARSLHSRTTNQSEFLSPAADNGATDYGLEFTTGHFEDRSPRRCSTFRSRRERQSHGDGSYRKSTRKSVKEAETPRSRTTTKPPSMTTKKQATKSKKSLPVMQQKATTSAARASETGPKEVRKKPRKQHNPLHIERRFWKEVKYLQDRSDCLIPRLPFSRLVRELIFSFSSEVTKITPPAFEALQTSSEMYITQRLQDAYLLTLHRGRVTLAVKDLELINFLKEIKI